MQNIKNLKLKKLIFGISENYDIKKIGEKVMELAKSQIWRRKILKKTWNYFIKEEPNATINKNGNIKTKEKKIKFSEESIQLFLSG